jgi:3-deoxy-manno-octulosonate cytidylyltransferase (CMP-KDO synthetase)
MVVKVYENVARSELLDDVIVAIDSDYTKKVLESYNVNMVMTSKKHRSGTDRVAEVVRGMDVDVIVNIQGDEPFLNAEIIDELVMLFRRDTSVQMATLASTAVDSDDILDKNTVKVTIDEQENAVTFVRSLAVNKSEHYFRHVGVYAYRKETLMNFVKLDPTAGEKELRLEQLRALENGIPIKIIITDQAFQGIDTMADITKLGLN